MNQAVQCPALLISAPASGQGKTTVVAAIARYHRNQGRDVRVFKTGPDFLDPKIHEQASGNPVHPLDLWLVGDELCRQQLFKAAAEADLILIEGVMGLFDGNPSSADLAVRFGVPVAAVIDARAMAETFGAVAKGLASYKPELNFSGVFANRVASVGHRGMLERSLPEGVAWLGHISRDETITLPERHLGLHQPDQIADLDERLDQAAALIAETPLAQLPDEVTFTLPSSPTSPSIAPLADTTTQPVNLLQGLTIAVAWDNAFSFVYPVNLDFLRGQGAELLFFSPLADDAIPDCDSLYLPGGYPELNLAALSGNTTMLASIRQHYQAGKTVVAECGGMLYLLESLTDAEGNTQQLTGIIEASAAMQPRLGGLGSQSVKFPAGELRGHTFHYSAFDASPAFSFVATKHPRGGEGEGVICQNRLTASYIHWYLPSNPRVAASLFLGEYASGTSVDEEPA